MTIDGSTLTPFVTWGTNPGQAAPLNSAVPDPASLSDATARASAERALTYMDLEPGTRLTQIGVDTVFLGSCTNGRLEDLRAAAEVLRGRTVASGVRMLVVPGSMEVKAAAEREGLAEVFTAAGAEWRSAGCSMCLGMNPRQAGTRPAQRVHFQPQLRGPPGQGCAHPPCLAAGRRRHRGDRPADRPGRPVTGLPPPRRPVTAATFREKEPCSHSIRIPAGPCHCAAATWTRIRSFPPNT